MCAKNITQSATCAYPAERLHSSADSEERKKERRKGRNKQSATSQIRLYGLGLQGSGLQAGVSGGQRGAVEGRHPLQAQSRTVIAVQKDTETPPSCGRKKQKMNQNISATEELMVI